VSPSLYNVATFANELVYVAEAGSLPGAVSRPARSGDNIALYANGLGATAAAHAVGEAFQEPQLHADASSVRVRFGSVEVVPQAANMTYAGLWQVNVKVPEVAPGQVAVSVQAGGEVSAPILLAVGR
jgi:uncharacterized protein (TIGR03437 family)